MSFPLTRLRRLRRSPALRRMVQETHLSADDFIYPIFVHDNDPSVVEEISAMPGQKRWGLERLGEILDEVTEVGIPAVILFGLPNDKAPQGENAWDEEGIFARAIRAAKAHAPDLVVISDVCFCSFTEHGHCGHWLHDVDQLDNDRTLEMLGKQAVAHARAGVDMLAPSDMTDGKIQAMRDALDAEGFVDLPIMSYSTKFASAFYGPFRVAAANTPGGSEKKSDRKSYQMPVANSDEALRESVLDLEEGADILMVKPALAFMDVILRIKAELGVPVAAYNVSGEYAMVKAAAAQGWIDGDKVMMEILISLKRSGADVILTYHAIEAARLLRKDWTW